MKNRPSKIQAVPPSAHPTDPSGVRYMRADELDAEIGEEAFIDGLKDGTIRAWRIADGEQWVQVIPPNRAWQCVDGVMPEADFLRYDDDITDDEFEGDDD